MNANNVPSSSSCETEMRRLEKLRLISADNQENVKTSNNVPKVRICTCEDSVESNNIYLVPRRTEEMLQSPLHRDMRAVYMEYANKSDPSYSGPCRIKETQAPRGESLNLYSKKSEESENIIEPRRTKDMLMSPIHRDLRAVHKGLENGSRNIYSEPRRTKGMMKPALLRQASQGEPLNLYSKKSDESEDFCLEPRRIKELLMSPIHRDMRAIYMGIANESKLSEETMKIYSEPRRTKELLQSPIHKHMMPKVRRQLQFEKQTMNIKLDRIANYLEQITEFQAISQRNIQQMGLQDFIKIIGHLLSNTGIPLKPLDKSNYIEQTIYAMELLNYPHKVRKSWLLMPSASIHHIVQMLDFLIDLLPTK